MHTVGKIDREIYKCITKDIVTDEVIITDERIGHIKKDIQMTMNAFILIFLKLSHIRIILSKRINQIRE